MSLGYLFGVCVGSDHQIILYIIYTCYFFFSATSPNAAIYYNHHTTCQPEHIRTWIMSIFTWCLKGACLMIFPPAALMRLACLQSACQPFFMNMTKSPKGQMLTLGWMSQSCCFFAASQTWVKNILANKLTLFLLFYRQSLTYY